MYPGFVGDTELHRKKMMPRSEIFVGVAESEHVNPRPRVCARLQNEQQNTRSKDSSKQLKVAERWAPAIKINQW